MYLLNIFIIFLDCLQVVFEISFKMNNIRSVLKLKLLFLKVYSDYIVFFKYGFLFFCKIIDWGLLKGV